MRTVRAPGNVSQAAWWRQKSAPTISLATFSERNAVDRPYTFFLLDGSAAPAAFEIQVLADAEAARAWALKLLQERPRYTAVEVFDGETSFATRR